MLGLGLSLTGNLQSSGLSPSNLFSVPGSRGFFYDFSDYTTQFTDTAGTTPVTGTGQSLARINDASGLGNNATQATAGSRALTQVRPMFTQRNRAVGSELPGNNFYWLQSPFVNGGVTITPLASGIDPSDGLPFYEFRAQGTPSATSVGFVAANVSNWAIPAVQGQVVTTSATLQRTGGTTAGVTSFRLAIEEQNNLNVTTAFEATSDFTGTDPTVISRTRTLTNAATVRVVSYPYLAVVIGVPVDVTFRIKAFQFELGSTRTTYQPAVSGERRNLLTYSEAFDNAAWIKDTATISANSAAAPDGTITADTITGVSGSFRAYQTVTTLINGTAYTMSAYVKQGTSPTIRLDFVNVAAGPVFTFSTASWSVVSGFTTTVQSVGDGWFRIAATYVSNTTNAGPGWSVSGTTTALIWGAQLELGPTYSRYQRVVTANEWYEDGFTSYRGIRFDGTDDFLQTAAIDFSNSDKMTVVAGVRKMSDAAQGMLVELTANAGTIPNSFNTQAPGPSTSYRIVSGGSLTAGAVFDATGLAAPRTDVLTGLANISGVTASLRANGVQVAGGSAAQGTGNFSNDIVYIGRRGGTSLPFNGILTFLCVINRVLTAAELDQLEAFANGKTGAYT